MKHAEALNLLIVEDNPSDFFLIEEMLSTSGLSICSIAQAETQAAAVTALQQNSVHLILLDLSLPDSYGIDTFLQIKETAAQVPVIILTGFSDAEAALAALQQGAQDYLVKGEFNTAILVRSIQYSIERKRSEEARLASEEKYRQVFYKNPLPMLISDEATSQILEVNDAAVAKYGYHKKELLQLCLNQMQQPFTDQFTLSLESVQSKELWVHSKKGGERMIVELTRYQINYFGCTAVQVQVNDVTDKLRLETELALKNHEMFQAVLNAQETERRVIGEELHDNINQILTAIKVGLGFVLEQTTDNKALLQKCFDNAGLAIDEVRRLSKALIVPGNLKELGLVASLDMLLKDFRSITSMEVLLDVAALDENLLSEKQKTTLYRIIQEQMNNVLKYAQASEVSIALSSANGTISLSVADNGRGFDPQMQAKGVGLYNIANRVKEFGGMLNIQTAPGKGCVLSLTMQNKTLLQTTP